MKQKIGLVEWPLYHKKKKIFKKREILRKNREPGEKPIYHPTTSRQVIKLTWVCD
jgi:hypothetical protein